MLGTVGYQILKPINDAATVPALARSETPTANAPEAAKLGARAANSDTHPCGVSCNSEPMRGIPSILRCAMCFYVVFVEHQLSLTPHQFPLRIHNKQQFQQTVPATLAAIPGVPAVVPAVVPAATPAVQAAISAVPAAIPAALPAVPATILTIQQQFQQFQQQF